VAGRPYGIGIYGTGRYGNGPAAVAYELAAQSQIAFQAFAKPVMVYAGTGAATSITLLPQAAFIRIVQPNAAAQISFSVQVRPNVIHQVAGQTQISFSVWGELVKTWQDPGPCFVPCEGGSWTQAFPPWVVRELA
jgi:hypothetical protein